MVVQSLETEREEGKVEAGARSGAEQRGGGVLRERVYFEVAPFTLSRLGLRGAKADI